MTLALASTTASIEQDPDHVDVLLSEISRTAAHPPLRYLGWIARRYGTEIASELDRRRRAQYGFCSCGHARNVRALYDERGRCRAHGVYCPTCEG